MDKLEQVKAKLEEMKAKYVLKHDEEGEDLLGSDGYLWWSGFFSCLKEISFFVDNLKQVDFELGLKAQKVEETMKQTKITLIFKRILLWFFDSANANDKEFSKAIEDIENGLI